MNQNPIFRMRRARNMTQARLAEACGVSARTIKRAEQGAPLSDETVIALCAVLGCTAADIAPPDGGTPDDDPGPRPATDPPAPGASFEALCGATALAAALSLLVAIGCIQVGYMLSAAAAHEIQGRVTPADEAAGRAALAILQAGAIAPLLLGASIAAREWPWLRARVPTWLPNGPYVSAVLASLTAVFPAMLVGDTMGQGAVLQSSTRMIGAALMPAFAVMAFVLGTHGGKERFRAVLEGCALPFAAMAVVVQAVGWATGDVASAAFSTGLLAPLVIIRRDLPETLRVTCVLAMSLPPVQIPWLDFALHPTPAHADLVTLASCAAVDALLLGVAVLPRRLPGGLVPG